MMIKAALLDERGVYQRMDELEDESKLTAQHLPRITECDLPAGEYVWQPAKVGERNPFGGSFFPLSRRERKAVRQARAKIQQH